MTKTEPAPERPTAELRVTAPASPSLGRRVVKFLGSLRLTVVFLLFGVALVFIGTIAQVDEGLYGAQHRYFRSLLIYWQPKGADWKLPVFPGGYFVGGVLLVNLVFAHAQRMKNWRNKIGLLIIHSGLVLLFVGQFATDLLSIESGMQLFEGESKNYSEDFRGTELVIVDTTFSADKERTYSIPSSLLKAGGDIRDARLPVALRVKKFWGNAGLVEPRTNNPPMAIASGATAGDLREILVIPTPGVADPESRNMPAAVIEVLAGDKSVGSFLASPLISRPEKFTVNGKQYEIALRSTRYYHPFNLTLLKATHEKYKGTEIPKNFASRVKVENASKNESRETVIYMNNPLRYSGLTFFQYQMGADEAAMRAGQKPSSTFQVVRNPSWLTPYLSCVMISAGLIIQFMQHLVGFVRKRTS